MLTSYNYKVSWKIRNYSQKQFQIVYLLGGGESQNILKIAVMGMGVAGSYLMARLKDTEHEVVGYERMIEERHDSICAWGTIKSELYKFC